MKTKVDDDEALTSGQWSGARDDAVAELFRVRRAPMARLAYVLTRDAELADEIAQEAFLRLHAGWERVDNPSAYLRTAVVNACHSHHRHLRVVRESPPQRPVADHVAPDNDDELSAALATLPYPQRAVLVLRYFCDLDDVEIAITLGIRRATVRTRTARALDRLRKEITP